MRLPLVFVRVEVEASSVLRLQLGLVRGAFLAKQVLLRLAHAQDLVFKLQTALQLVIGPAIEGKLMPLQLGKPPHPLGKAPGPLQLDTKQCKAAHKVVTV